MARNTLAAASIALLALCAVSAPVQAGTTATLVIQTAPPPLRYEVLPPARPGKVWVPGHWEWRGDQYVWVNGYWIKSRPGYVYSPPVWVEINGQWHWRQGGWNHGRGHDMDHDGVPNRYDRDRDGDGIPNQYDRHPNGGKPHPRHDRDHDGVPNRYDRDRDGDGVRNRHDRRPDNPHRN